LFFFKRRIERKDFFLKKEAKTFDSFGPVFGTVGDHDGTAAV
jgi:hypothetical protein